MIDYSCYVGVVYGRLTVLDIALIKYKSKNKSMAICACSCGRDNVRVWLNDLKTGNTKSCGCLRRELISQKNSDAATHRMSSHVRYHSWRQMMDRCYNKENNSWVRYGKRGIKVCEVWHNPIAYCKWCDENLKIGEEVDRIDNNGDYSPDNCRSVTKRENGRNTRTNKLIFYRGRSLCVAGWAEEIGMPYCVLYSRVKRGWSPERAIETPIRRWPNKI